MKFKSKYKLITWCIAIVFLSFSCEELPCEYTDGAQVNAGFYKSNGVAISDTLIGSFSLVLQTKIDNPYIEDYVVRTKIISFPLSITEDTSTVILTFQDLIADTIIFKYDRTLALKSHACGFDTFFEITEIINTNNRIDSIWVKKDLIEYGDQENIKIYF